MVKMRSRDTLRSWVSGNNNAVAGQLGQGDRSDRGVAAWQMGVNLSAIVF